QQVEDERRVGVLALLLAVALGALLVVLEFRPRPLRDVEVLVALGRLLAKVGQLVRRRARPVGRRGRPVGRVRLVIRLLVAHHAFSCCASFAAPFGAAPSPLSARVKRSRTLSKNDFRWGDTFLCSSSANSRNSSSWRF